MQQLPSGRFKGNHPAAAATTTAATATAIEQQKQQLAAIATATPTTTTTTTTFNQQQQQQHQQQMQMSLLPGPYRPHIEEKKLTRDAMEKYMRERNDMVIVILHAKVRKDFHF